MKLLIMLLLSTVCFAQIRVKKTYVIYEKDTLMIVNKQLLYTDTILYLENGSSIRISKDLLYYYAHQVYLKFKYNKKYNKYIRL
jgi:hypothetical protein